MPLLSSVLLFLLVLVSDPDGQATCTNWYGPQVTIGSPQTNVYSFWYRDLDNTAKHEFRLESGSGRGYTNVRIQTDFTLTVKSGVHYHVYLVGVDSCGNRNTGPILIWSR